MPLRRWVTAIWLTLALLVISCRSESSVADILISESNIRPLAKITNTPSDTNTAEPNNTPSLTPTHTSTSSPTVTPTPTDTPNPTNTPTPTMTPTPLPADSYLGPFNHQAQTENNCGPASVAILLGYYDYWISQFVVNDAGLNEFPSPCEIVRYIRENYGQESERTAEQQVIDQTLKARVYRLPSSRQRDKLRPMKHLHYMGVPMIVYQRLREDSDIGHYRVIHGYDDSAAVFIADDPYLGASTYIPYEKMSDYLFELNVSHIIIPIYPIELDEYVQSSLLELGAARVYLNCFH